MGLENKGGCLLNFRDCRQRSMEAHCVSQKEGSSGEEKWSQKQGRGTHCLVWSKKSSGASMSLRTKRCASSFCDA